jgi:hypothetical protein
VLYPTDSIASFPVDTYKDPARLFTAPAFAAKSQRKTSARVSFSPHESFISDSQNQFRIEGASRRSESLFAIDREGYAPALGLGRTGAASPIPLLPEKTVAALKSILSEIRRSSSRRPDTLIYGQATLDGAPIEGVSVQIQGAEEAKPVYLNELFIPDAALTQTASHGLFVFEGLDEGYYSFVGQRSSQFFGFGNAVTSLSTVSYLNLQAQRVRYPMSIKSYQAFNSEEVSSTITLQGSGFPLDVLGTGLIEHPSTAALEIAKVEPQDLRYATTIVPFWGEDDHLFAPLVSREWLAKISTEAQVAVSPDAGVVLGFVEKGAYDIFWPHLAQDYPVKIIYFDREGLKSLTPVDGGGFIAFNIPPSAQTLVLQDRFGFVASRVIPVDAGVLTTLIF